MNHQAAIPAEVFALAGDDDCRVRQFSRDERLRTNEVFQSLVVPDAAEEQNRLVRLARPRAIRRTLQADVRDNIHVVRRDPALADDDLLHLFRVHDES